MSDDSKLVDNDPANAPGDLAALEQSLKEAVTKKPDDGNATKKTNAPNLDEKPEWMPKKFWTGDLDESIQKMAGGYSSLESAYGRMANDLGHQRKMTDQILALDKRSKDLGDPSATKTKTRPKVDATKLVNDPTAALDEYWAAREAELRQEFQETSRQQQLQVAEQNFLRKHPDYQEITQDKAFENWVMSSPLRARAAQAAGQGDYTMADELLTEYKALQGAGPEPLERDENGNNKTRSRSEDLTEQARRVSLESSAQAKGSSSSDKKIYRRADLIQLKLEKPSVYSDPAFQEEILRAYAEGRVK